MHSFPSSLLTTSTLDFYSEKLDLIKKLNNEDSMQMNPAIDCTSVKKTT